MKKLDIMNKLTRTFNSAGTQLKKHSPEILIVAGIIGGVASAVLACKATTKVGKVLEETKEKIDGVHEATEKGVTNAGETYTAEDSKKDLSIIYVQTGVKFLKLYGPAIALGAASITSILASHRIVHKRNLALAAGLSTLDNSFKKYRDNVVERFGEKVDKELKYGLKPQEVEETVTDENGKEKTVKKTVMVADDESVMNSPYAKFFDNGNDGWDPNPEYTRMFLISQQNYANDLLKSKGRLYLNEVYDMLDIPRTKLGQIHGWKYDPDNPDLANFVDFGIFDLHRKNCRDFVNGIEQTILLDFNCDGDIWSDM